VLGLGERLQILSGGWIAGPFGEHVHVSTHTCTGTDEHWFVYTGGGVRTGEPVPLTC
jgi:hypothetical protein